MDIKLNKRLLLAILFSLGFMVFLLMRLDWKHFSLIAGRLNIKDLIAAYSVFILGNLIRSVRFYRLDNMDKKLMHWWNINAFYNFVTSTLPGGAGEAATAYALKRYSKLDILGAFRILLISRLLDIFAISALFFISALLITGVTTYRETALWISGVLLLFSLFALIPASEQFVMKLLKKLPGNSAIIRKVSEKLSELLKVSEEQRSNNSYAITLLQSVLMMIAGIISIHLALRAFGVDFTLVQSFYCYGIYAVFQVIPVQGIAGIGTQAAWWALALNAAGYQSHDAIAMGFILHGAFYLIIIFMGLFSLLFWLKGRGRGDFSC